MPDNARRIEYIFVGGAPRSGTTLLQNMLDSHPEILGGPEFIHLTDIIGLRVKLQSAVSQGWIRDYCSRLDIDNQIRRLIDELLLPFVIEHERDCIYFSEKTPSNVLAFRDLIDLYPTARFIHLVRDPRSVIASLLLVGSRAKNKGIRTARYTENIELAIKYTRNCLDAGFASAQIAPDRVLTITYEQLVTDPESETKRICDFLGIEWNRQMLYPGETSHPGEDAITKNSGEIWYDLESYYRNPVPFEINKWKSVLTRGQELKVARSLGSLVNLKDLGYDLTPSSIFKPTYFCNLVRLELSPLLRTLAGKRKS